MKKVITLLFISIGLIILGIITYYSYLFLKLSTSVVTTKQIKFSTLGEDLYFKEKLRGLNYSSTVLSKSASKSFTPDPVEEFVWYNRPIIFYKTTDDSLIIYTTLKAEFPKKFDSKVIISQIEIKNAELLSLEKHFQKENLIRFPPNK
jgi:hypothetical protein